jgi:hypothetical protein
LFIEGIFYQNGTIKPYMQDLTVDCGGASVPTTDSPPSPANAPTAAPVRTPVNSTTSPTELPTLAIVETPTATPTAVTSEIPTLIPTIREESAEPSVGPTDTIDSPADSLSVVPSEVPSDVPTIEPDIGLCQSNDLCAALDLAGQCCPTADGITLLCCGSGVVEETCAGNDQCAVYELTDGLCCPTVHEDIPAIHNKYLDCCTILPDQCKITNDTQDSNCERMSAVEYKLLLEQSNSASRSAAAIPSRHLDMVSVRYVMLSGTVLFLSMMLPL